MPSGDLLEHYPFGWCIGLGEEPDPCRHARNGQNWLIMSRALVPVDSAGDDRKVFVVEQRALPKELAADHRLGPISGMASGAMISESDLLAWRHASGVSSIPTRASYSMPAAVFLSLLQ